MKKIQEMTNEELKNTLQTIKQINSNQVSALINEIEAEITKREEKKFKKEQQELKNEVNYRLKRAEEQKTVLGNVYIFETDYDKIYFEVIGVEGHRAIVNKLTIKKMNKSNAYTMDHTSFKANDYISITELKTFKTTSFNDYLKELHKYQDDVNKRYKICELWNTNATSNAIASNVYDIFKRFDLI